MEPRHLKTGSTGQDASKRPLTRGSCFCIWPGKVVHTVASVSPQGVKPYCYPTAVIDANWVDASREQPTCLLCLWGYHFALARIFGSGSNAHATMYTPVAVRCSDRTIETE